MERKLSDVKVNNMITGTVYKVTKNEVTVDIGYVTEGTIYLNELTKQPVDSCEEVVKEGDEIEVIVKKVDDEAGIVLLSRLEIEERKAFDTLQTYFDENTTFEAKVLKTNKGGLLLSGIGYDRLFMPFSEISTDYVSSDDAEKFVGKTLNVRVIEIKRNRVIVSHKIVERVELKKMKKEELKDINVGDVLEGEVSRIMPYGAFVRFGQVEGLLHISEISHYNVKNVKDTLKEGQKVNVKVIDQKNDKRSLSMKALEKSPWDTFQENHKVGDEVTGKVVKKMQFGMLLEVEKEVVGMLNRYDYSWDPRYNVAGDVEVGDDINVKVINIDTKNKRMTLSKKHLEYNPWEDVEVKVGESVSGEVKELQDNGAIVDVHGVNAFLPIGEIVDRRIGSVSEELKVEDVINAVVKRFDKRAWQMVISKKDYDERQVREEYKKHLKSENKDDQTQTLGELFAEKLKDFK